jgi:hypothetical protein
MVYLTTMSVAQTVLNIGGLVSNAVLGRLDVGIVGSNLTRGMDVYVYV